MGYVYKITNLVNQKCYVGQTKAKDVKKRWREHSRGLKGKGKRVCPALNAAFIKYGLQSFKFEIICICFDKARLELEKRYIKKFKSESPSGYNLNEGGHAPRMNADTRAKMSIAQTGKIFTPEHRANLSKAKKGVPLGKGKYKWTEASKKKLSASMRKSKKAQENLKRLAEKNRGRKLTAEHIKKCTKHLHIKVIQKTLDGLFIKEWTSATEAERELGLSKGGIGQCCRGHYNSANGYLWDFATPSKEIVRKEPVQQEKPVMQLTLAGELIKTWCSVREAHRELKIARSQISRVCMGLPKYITAGGFKWKYADN